VTAGSKAPPIAAEVEALVRVVLESPSDERREALDALARAGEFRVVPDLLPLFAGGGAIAAAAGRTIAALVEGRDPATLAWIDHAARPSASPLAEWIVFTPLKAWYRLTPFRATWLARQQAAHVGAIGLLACHPSGYVRLAALKALDRNTDGREIPFLALRANDWVAPVAEAAESMLLRRLVPDNRPTVMTALPFLVRLFGQRRRDSAGALAERLRDVLLSDGGSAVLSAMDGFPRAVRRTVFEIIAPSPAALNPAVLDAALADRDAGVRRATVRWLGAGADAARAIALLERLAVADPVPAVRRAALTLLAERDPARVAGRLPVFLLDRGAGVRSLARFFAREAGSAIEARRFYAERLADASSARQLAAALAGLGETGAPDDASLAAARLGHAAPAVRCAALRALTDLAADQGMSAALAALDDPASSVHATAVSILRRHVRSVDAATVRLRVRASADPRRRLRALPLLAAASKWDAAVSLVESLGDPDAAVQARAAQLLRAWHAAFWNSFVQPGPAHIRRLQALLDADGGNVPSDILTSLRYELKIAGASLQSH
jgi:hypothetical protein